MENPPIRGMENVVATVSGYKGTHRFDLIKLISRSGASYVGVLSPSTTHLVCWNFQGEKYELAKRLGVTIVNHRWVEDCVSQGKRLPEYPYTLKCGQEVGQLTLAVDGPESLNKKRKILVDKSNVCVDYGTRTDQGDPEVIGWTSSSLLNQDLFHNVPKRKGSSRLNPQQGRVLKPIDPSSSRFLSEDIPVSKLLQFEHEVTESKPSSRSVRGKGKVPKSKKLDLRSNVCLSSGKAKLSDNVGRICSPESSHGPQRFTKKTVSIDHLETLILDSDDECEPIRVNNETNVTAAPCHLGDCERQNGKCVNGVTLDANDLGSTNEVLDCNEEITGLNDSLANLNRHPDDSMPVIEILDSDAAVESLKEKINEVAVPEPSTRSPPSTDLSCVICWTEFSPTRGILPCGHRFCYSCIESWANQMVSRGKISTCPLCKASFLCIKKVEDANTVDQKIYSQSIPSYTTVTDTLLFMDTDRNRFSSENRYPQVCCGCHHREPEDLLISCQLCDIRCIHMYCMDPYMSRWVCAPCKELGMLYQHNR